MAGNHLWPVLDSRRRGQAVGSRRDNFLSREDAHVVVGFRESGSRPDLNEATRQREPADLVDGNESRMRRGTRQPRTDGRPLTVVTGAWDAGRKSVVPSRRPTGDLANGAGARLGRLSARCCPDERPAITRRRRESNDSANPPTIAARVHRLVPAAVSADRRFPVTAAVIIPQAGRPGNHLWQFGSARWRCQSAWDRLHGLVSREDVHVVFESWEFRVSGSGTDLTEAITPCRPEDLVDGNESSKRRGVRQPRNVRLPLSLVGPDPVAGAVQSRRAGQAVIWPAGPAVASGVRPRVAVRGNDRDQPAAGLTLHFQTTDHRGSAASYSSPGGGGRTGDGCPSRVPSSYRNRGCPAIIGNFGTGRRRCQAAWDRRSDLVPREDAHVFFGFRGSGALGIRQRDRRQRSDGAARAGGFG